MSTQTLTPAPISAAITDRPAAPIWQTWFSRIAGVVNAAFASYDSSISTLNTTVAPLSAGHTSWAPSVSPSGSMTLSAWTYYDGVYYRIGPRVFVQLQITFTLGGTASNQLTVPLPVTALAGYQASSASALTCNIWAAGTAGWQPAFAYVSAQGGDIVCQLSQAANFPLGATWLMFAGSYRVG